MASQPRLLRWTTYFFILLSLSLFGFALSTLITTRLLRRVSIVKVPDLRHKSVESARSILRVKRLRIEIAEFRFDRRIPLNSIMAQVPAADQIVKSGRTIQVVVSRGSQAVKIPDISGLELRKAALSLGEKGLNIGRTTRIFDMQSPKNTILDHNPAAGDYAVRGSSINLLVSQGPRPIWFIMPGLKGRHIDNASRMLSHIGMELREIKRRQDDNQPSGTVLDQTPKPGGRVQASDPAGLTVSIQSADQQQTTRLVTVKYHVPPANMEVRIKMVARDDTGLHEIYSAMEKPNSEFTIRRTIHGAQAVLYIYINGKLHEERKI
jgi:serine/threonine-protein kinase